MSPHYLSYVLPHAPPGVRAGLECAIARGGLEGARTLGAMLREGAAEAGDWLLDHGAEPQWRAYLLWYRVGAITSDTVLRTDAAHGAGGWVSLESVPHALPIYRGRTLTAALATVAHWNVMREADRRPLMVVVRVETGGA